MNTKQPRRPAQMRPGQIELIEGDIDTAVNSELAHATAQVVVPLESSTNFYDDDVTRRIEELIATEGVDSIAEAWVRSPEDSLPGILWRGYLLSQWIRREPEEAALRYAAASKAHVSDEDKINAVVSPKDIYDMWEKVFEGGFSADFAKVLDESAKLTEFLGSVHPVWIEDEDHPLATEVTRRDAALAKTAQEFFAASALLAAGRLQ